MRLILAGKCKVWLAIVIYSFEESNGQELLVTWLSTPFVSWPSVSLVIAWHRRPFLRPNKVHTLLLQSSVIPYYSLLYLTLTLTLYLAVGWPHAMTSCCRVSVPWITGTTASWVWRSIVSYASTIVFFVPALMRTLPTKWRMIQTTSIASRYSV